MISQLAVEEFDHVAVLNEVLLSFGADEALVAGGGPAASLEELLPFDDLCTNKFS